MNPKTNSYYTRLRPYLKNKDVQNYSYAAFSLIAITIFAVFAIRPAVKTIISLQKTIQTQSQVLASLKQREESDKQGITNYQNDFDNTTKLSLLTLLPSTTSVQCLVDTLNTKTKDVQVIIDGMQIQPVDLVGTSRCNLTEADLSGFDKNPGSQPQAIHFTINVHGQYADFITLLDSLKQSSRLITIDSIHMSKEDTGGLSLSINGTAYYYK